jgi:holo-[acyl-carrier protein] synthase
MKKWHEYLELFFCKLLRLGNYSESHKIATVGIDIVDVERFEWLVTKFPSFMQRFFHPNEQVLNKHSLAARFAAKEALLKAGGPINPLLFRKIEIEYTSSGVPYFTGNQVSVNSKLKDFQVSISHSQVSAVAIVIKLK